MQVGDFEAVAALVRQLQRQPQAFGPAVEAVECIETHIPGCCWRAMVSTSSKAFGARFPRFQHRRAAPRSLPGRAAHQPAHRSRPLPGLVAVQDQGGALRVLPADEARGDAEPAVHMRRFAQEDLLSHVLEQQRLQSAHIDALARQVAQFHGQAAVAQPGQGWEHAAGRAGPVHDCVQALQQQEEGAPSPGCSR